MKTHNAGLTGSIGAIHANRLSTFLHTSLSNPKQNHSHSLAHHAPSKGLTAPQSMITLWLLSFPTMGCFYAFVLWVGWIDVSLGIWGWIGYAITVSVPFLDDSGADEKVTLSLLTSHTMTLFFWSKNLDPE